MFNARQLDGIRIVTSAINKALDRFRRSPVVKKQAADVVKRGEKTGDTAHKVF